MNPTHIKMFDTPEIQDYKWNFETDFRAWSKKHQKIIYPLNVLYVIPHKNNYIFLPSIEQMAEMWHEAKDHETRNTIGATFALQLSAFVEKNFYEEWFIADWPLPIIVLAFIMKDLFSLTWDTEEGWV